MPNDTINNAIKKASGEGDNKNYEEIVYEGYGTNGVAVIVEASTDNKNRTAADVRICTSASKNSNPCASKASLTFEKSACEVVIS